MKQNIHCINHDRKEGLRLLDCLTNSLKVYLPLFHSTSRLLDLFRPCIINAYKVDPSQRALLAGLYFELRDHVYATENLASFFTF